MKAFPVFCALCTVLSLFSCGKPTEVTKDASIKGYAQKGPFITGTKLLISELNSSLSETGRNFTGTITDDKGTFDMTVQNLASSFVSISSDGFYFDEVSGQLSSSRLILNALIDISAGQSININILTHLETERIKYLVLKGSSFSQAKAQAEKEILKIFAVNNAIPAFENLDISKNTEGDAILLAISAILQGTHTVAQLTELLAKISLDIKEDGILNSEALKSELINEAQLLNLVKVRENISKRYKDLGVATTIGSFEPIIENFKKNSGFVFTKKIDYPKTNSVNVLNILSLTSDTLLQSKINYGLNANLPNGTSLKVVLKGTTTLPFGSSHSIGLTKGWKIISATSGNHSFQTVDALTEGFFTPEHGGTIIVEIYENEATTPTRTFTIKSTAFPFITIDATGKYGKNILAQPYSSTYTTGDYSLQLKLDDVKEHTILIEFYYPFSNNIVFSNAEGWSMVTTVDNLNANWRKTALTIKATKISADLKVTLSGTGSTNTQGWVDGALQDALYKKMAW